MKKLFILFYIFYILIGAVSLVFVPNVLSYPYVSEFSIFIIFLPTLIQLIKLVGYKKAFTIIFVLGLYALSVEYIGLVTGMPYGSFAYNPKLGGKIGEILPWTVSLSYTTILLGCIGLSFTLTKKKIARIVSTVVFLLIADLILDPGAVAIAMWSFTDWGYYYGVPMQNFIGWIITGIPASCIGYYFFKNSNQKKMLVLTYSFCMSMSIWVCIAFLKLLWIPFVLGLCVISTLLVLYYRHEKNTSN